MKSLGGSISKDMGANGSAVGNERTGGARKERSDRESGEGCEMGE